MALTQEIREWLVSQTETCQSHSFSLKTQRLQIEREGRHLVAKADGCKNSLSTLTKPSILTFASIYLLMCCIAAAALIHHLVEMN